MTNPLQLYYEFLRNRLDCSSGFLDYLVACDVLKDDERNKLNLQNNYYEQNEQVLNLLWQRLSKPDSEDFEKVLKALRNSGQEHLEQHIRNGRGTSDEDIDSSQACSPLPSSQITEISKLMGYLCNERKLHCTKALLSKLVQEKCITKVHRDRLRAMRVKVDRSHILVNLIKRGSVGSLLKTVEVLRKLGQTEAAEKLKNSNSAYTAQIHVSFCYESKIKNENSRQKNSEDEDRRSQSPFTGREEASGGTFTNMSGKGNVKYKPTTADGQPFNCKESNADSTVYNDAIITTESRFADFSPNAAAGSAAAVFASLIATGEIVAENSTLCRSLSNICISDRGENILAEKGRLLCNGKKNGDDRLLAVSNGQLEESAIVGYTSHTDINFNNGQLVCANGTNNNFNFIYNCYGVCSNRNCSSCSEKIENCQIIAEGCGNDINASELSVQNKGMGNNLTNNEMKNDLEQKLVMDIRSHLKTVDEAKIEEEEFLLEQILKQFDSSKEGKELVLQLLKAKVIRIAFGQSILLSYYCEDVSEMKQLIKVYESNLLQKVITAFVMAFIKDNKEYDGLTVANVELDLEDMKRWCERVSSKKREQMFSEEKEFLTRRTTVTTSAAITSSLLSIHDDSETVDTAPMSSSSFEQPVSERKTDSSSLPISLTAETSSSSSSIDSFSSSDDSDLEDLEDMKRGCERVSSRKREKMPSEEDYSERKSDSSSLPISSFAETSSYSPSPDKISVTEYEMAKCRDVDTSEDLLGFAGKQSTSESLQGDVLKKQLGAGLRVKKEAVLKLPIKDSVAIQGVTYLDSFYYCLVNGFLYKFEAKPPYLLRESLEIPDIKYPTDIAACPQKKRLYVGDIRFKCVWCIDVSNFKSSIIIKDVPSSLCLSVTSDGRILTADSNFNIKIFSSDGTIISSYDRSALRLLSKEFDHLWHVVEKPSGRLLMCCGKYDDTFQGYDDTFVEINISQEIVARVTYVSLDQPLVLERAEAEKEQGKYLPVSAETESKFQIGSYFSSLSSQRSSRETDLFSSLSEVMEVLQLRNKYDIERLRRLQYGIANFEHELWTINAEIHKSYADISSAPSHVGEKKSIHEIAPVVNVIPRDKIVPLLAGDTQETGGSKLDDVIRMDSYARIMKDFGWLKRQLRSIIWSIEELKLSSHLKKESTVTFKQDKTVPAVSIQPEDMSICHLQLTPPVAKTIGESQLQAVQETPGKTVTELSQLASQPTPLSFSYYHARRRLTRVLDEVEDLQYSLRNMKSKMIKMKLRLGFRPSCHSTTLTLSSASSVPSEAATDSMPIKPSIAVINPRYIALGPPDSDTFFFCDRDNDCILLVSGDMKTARVIVDLENGCPRSPCKIHYDVEHRRLLVGAEYDSVIHIFNV